MIKIRNLAIASLVVSGFCTAPAVMAQSTEHQADGTSLMPLPELKLDRALLKDVKQFVKLANKVRFFYPSQAVAETDWDKFVAETVVAMSQVHSYQRHQLGLQKLREIAPFINDLWQQLPELSDSDPAVAWKQSAARTFYAYQRLLSHHTYSEIKQNRFLPERDFVRVRYGWRTVLLPLVLPQHASEQGQSYRDYRRWQVGTDFKSLPVCMSTVSGMWSEIQHFWPYFEQIEVNWQQALGRLLKACAAETQFERAKAIQREFKKLQDNHVYIYFPDGYQPKNTYEYPFRVRWVEDKAVVTGISETESQLLEIGDELIAINDESFASMVDDRASWLARSEHISAYSATLLLNYTALNDPIRAEFRKADGSSVQVEATPIPVGEANYTIHHPVVPRESSVVTELEEGLWQLSLYNLTQENLEEAKLQLQKARAVVLDLRHYPRDFLAWHEGLSWFIKQPVTNHTLYEYWQKGPGRRANYQLPLPSTIEVSTSPLHVPVIALSSKTARSQTEYALTFVKEAGIPVLGVPTSGINGDYMPASYFSSDPNGGVTLIYTGLRADNADGSALIARGVQPDIYVPRTLDSIIVNEDNQLMAAIEYLKDQL
ncbi:hypothetical protein PRUB_b0193 [Pseudoalteromonas rubra]|uniref:Tail specific protease domain-containing protein n=1 Tax=Pseudoalteromonas rubra TaxID=43658 RepID=A0A8T0C053_9GAMM|nr:S41 family peptidase [Pseudoalteromonas rubra]KAF7781084.1 hypothetical protein PRUB_b0193 [Pseudoalteromonas rubra]